MPLYINTSDWSSLNESCSVASPFDDFNTAGRPIKNKLNNNNNKIICIHKIDSFEKLKNQNSK